MSIPILKAMMVVGLTAGILVTSSPAGADGKEPNAALIRDRGKVERVPEIPAKGLAAGVLVLAGGAAVIFGRRRRAR